MDMSRAPGQMCRVAQSCMGRSPAREPSLLWAPASTSSRLLVHKCSEESMGHANASGGSIYAGEQAAGYLQADSSSSTVKHLPADNIASAMLNLSMHEAGWCAPACAMGVLGGSLPAA